MQDQVENNGERGPENHNTDHEQHDKSPDSQQGQTSADGHPERYSVSKFNQRIEQMLQNLNNLDVEDIFDQKNSDQSTKRQKTITEATTKITDHIAKTVHDFDAAGHPLLESTAHHKLVGLKTLYAVVMEKLNDIADGDQLLPPKTAQQLREEIESWRTTLITTADAVEYTVEVNTSDIPTHTKNFSQSDRNEIISDTYGDRLRRLGEQQSTLLKQASSESKKPVELTTLRHMMDYADNLLESEDQITDGVSEINIEDAIDQDALRDLKVKLSVTARYLPGNPQVQSETDKAIRNIDQLLAEMEATTGENTDHMTTRLEEVSHALSEAVLKLVDVNQAQHP